jgi:hypothetical protein
VGYSVDIELSAGIAEPGIEILAGTGIEGLTGMECSPGISEGEVESSGCFDRVPERDLERAGERGTERVAERGIERSAGTESSGLAEPRVESLAEPGIQRPGVESSGEIQMVPELDFERFAGIVPREPSERFQGQAEPGLESSACMDGMYLGK